MVQHEMSEQIKETVIPMKETIERLQKKVEFLEKDLADTNQFSRRLNDLISYAQETEKESTDCLAITLAAESGSAVTKDDNYISYGVGIKNDDASKPRDIVVRFKTYKAKINFMQGRKQLREKKSSHLINKQLCSAGRKLACQCRQLKRITASSVVDT